ncbi:MAG: response regulator [Candidatus Omnitrophota bacterium]
MVKERKDLKVLIVDDDEKSLKLLEIKLRQMGFENILKADCGHKCLEIARSQRPDLIFLDFMMPGMDGGDVKFEISNDKNLKDIPVIYATAIITQKEVESIGGETTKGIFVSKPYDTEMIEKVLQKVLQ